MQRTREQIGRSRRWVIKFGSALITNEGRGLNVDSMDQWTRQISQLCEAQREVSLVSSGAVAEGMSRLGWSSRPAALHELQAAAAVGQMGLVQAYQAHFQRYGYQAAQVLLTHEDLSDRKRYLNARSTLRTLLQLGVIPVVNENDTVATDEIRFGDNDTLAGLVANLIEADLFVILTDQAGLFERDPRQYPDAPLIREAAVNDPRLTGYAAGSGGQLGRGGMATKLIGAKRAARSGTATIIAPGREPGVLTRIAAGEQLGTLLHPISEPMAARKQWIAGHLHARGALWLDQGAAQVIRQHGRSLLPVGVTGVEGNFRRGEVVRCFAPDGQEIARGLVNYDANEAERIKGQPSEAIAALLGYVDDTEIVHRDNLVLL